MSIRPNPFMVGCVSYLTRGSNQSLIFRKGYLYMSHQKMCVLVCAVLMSVIFVSAQPVSADQNIHTLTGTMNDCWCDYYVSSDDYLCWTNFTVAAPPPHFDLQNTTTIVSEIEGEAIGQCGDIQLSLPRPVQMLFWLEAAGTDFIHSVQRSPVKGYYLIQM